MKAIFYLASLTLVVFIMLPVAALCLGADVTAVHDALVDPDVWAAIGLSLGCATMSTVLSVLLGTPLAFLLAHRRLPWSGLWQALIDVCVVIPHPVVGLGLLYVFAHRAWAGSALATTFGFDVASALPGIVLAMWTVFVPLLVKSARDGFLAVPVALEQVAANLGAGDARIFFAVSLPGALPWVRSGALLAWARAVGEFGSVVIVAYYPRTAPVLIWDRFSAQGMTAAMAPALVLVWVCLSLFLLLQAAHRRLGAPP